jgi:hypothetical protein
MNDLTPEQVDAVFDAMWPSTQDGPIQEAARAILTTTDPDAQAALAANLPTDVMLTALVERGALHGERQLSAGPIPVYRTEHRLVTQWRPVSV